MIDFTNCVEEFNSYRGSEKKKTLIYNGDKYLVKFPDPVREKNKNISYINNAFSEYVGSNIFKIVGMEVQNTILGIYKYNDKEKIVCACCDFTDDNNLLYEFENLALSTNPDKKIGTELLDIIQVIAENKMINSTLVMKNFWDMFVIDFIIGNTDRHNGNWGFLVNKGDNKIMFSPIYDCGSCLNPMLEDKDIESFDDAYIKNLAINCYSCIKIDNKKINYVSFITSMEYSDCNDAIKRMFDKIDMDKIFKFIDSISCMSSIRRNFYKSVINYRYEILMSVYNKL